MLERQSSLRRKTTVLAIAVAVQVTAAAFFLFDLVVDVREDGLVLHLLFEAMAVIGLLGGVIFGTLQILWLVERTRLDQAAVATAKGAMSDLLRLRFMEWKLTVAEVDVALFAIKGFDIAEIATLRHAAHGTVRAQLTRIYAKAGVKSQVELMALFVEDLVERFE